MTRSFRRLHSLIPAVIHLPVTELLLDLTFQVLRDSVNGLSEEQDRSVRMLKEETMVEDRLLNDELDQIHESVAWARKPGAKDKGVPPPQMSEGIRFDLKLLVDREWVAGDYDDDNEAVVSRVPEKMVERRRE
ncbi:hypothetical protein LINPERHAP2_LOCUS33456 [Linum perenne]